MPRFALSLPRAHTAILAAALAALAGLPFALSPQATTGATQSQQAALPLRLRIGYLAAHAQACSAPEARAGQLPPGLASYARIIAARLDVAVSLCGFASSGQMARAFADGTLDFAPLSAEAFAQAQGHARPILTTRRTNALPRTPVVAIARASLARGPASAIAAHPLIFAGAGRFLEQGPREALISRGGTAANQQTSTRAKSMRMALANLREDSSEYRVLLVPADLWQAACTSRPKACKGLHIVWQGRPRARMAWSVRTALPAEWRYRLAGIGLSLPATAPTTFAALAGKDAEAFEPTEASALSQEPGR